jgi:hypothetical protein
MHGRRHGRRRVGVVPDAHRRGRDHPRARRDRGAGARGPALDAAVAAAFVTAVGEDLGRDSSGIADELLHQGVFICATLSVAEASPDEAVAVYEQYLAEDPDLTGPLWNNAVRHLCPELVDAYELVLDRAQAAG